MPELVIRGVAVRFDQDERVELKTADLAASREPALNQLAVADRRMTVGHVTATGDDDGWVTSDEVRRTSGLYADTHFAYIDFANQARRTQFAGKTVFDLRLAATQGAAPTLPAADPLGVPSDRMAELPRSAFVPLGEHVAARFAMAESYEAFYGNPGDRVYHFNCDDLVPRYSMHELKAALAILTAREGGWEFALSKDAAGHYHLVQGSPDKVELDAGITGLDLLFHTHPRDGATSAHPSRGDISMAVSFDPDHRGGAVSQDGWFTEYAINDGGGTDTSAPERLWRAQR